MVSILALIYPLASAVYNNHHKSIVCTNYAAAAAQEDQNKLDEVYSAAVDYNNTLGSGVKSGNFDPAALKKAQESYAQQLNLVGDGMMGWVEIPKINVKIPIFHGTADATLARGVGHLLGSSLPVGGESTHCVLTAHSGMANNIMFSDLPLLQTGDLFYIHVLDRVLTYQVDQIVTVLPEDTSALMSESGHDYCTLITCTPFGVNTHRLLVRGERIVTDTALPLAEEKEKKSISTWLCEYLKGIGFGLIIAGSLLLLFSLLLLKRKRWEKRNGKSV